MRQLFYRTVALALVPCLLVEPVTFAACQNLATSAIRNTHGAVLLTEAMADIPLTWSHKILFHVPFLVQVFDDLFPKLEWDSRDIVAEGGNPLAALVQWKRSGKRQMTINQFMNFETVQRRRLNPKTEKAYTRKTVAKEFELLEKVGLLLERPGGVFELNSHVQALSRDDFKTYVNKLREIIIPGQGRRSMLERYEIRAVEALFITRYEVLRLLTRIIPDDGAAALLVPQGALALAEFYSKANNFDQALLYARQAYWLCNDPEKFPATMQVLAHSLAMRSLGLMDSISRENLLALGFEGGLNYIDEELARLSKPVMAGQGLRDILRAHVRQALTLDPARRKLLFDRYELHLQMNKETLSRSLGVMDIWDEWYQAIQSAEAFTSFPTEELHAARYVMIFGKKNWQREIRELRSHMPPLTSKLTYGRVFGPIDSAIQRLLKDVPVRDDERDQVEQELRLHLYRALLDRPGTEARVMKLGLTTSRDGQQSNIGTLLTGEDQRTIIDLQAELGTIHTLETWGGALPQTALLKDAHPDRPEDPWFNLRAQTLLLGEKMRQLIGGYKDQMKPGDFARLMNRYEISSHRQILKEAELHKLLSAYEPLAPGTALGNQVVNLYRINQEMLLRGQNIVGLEAYPDSVLKLFVETAYKNGVDVFRIFDALNDCRKIEPAIGYARAAGARIQPVIHYTTDFPLGIPEYVRLAERLVRASGDALDALVIKDAGGLLEPAEAFNLVKALREGLPENMKNIPIHLHTHDTRGNRQLTLLEAIRANGNRGPIIVDVAAGKNGLSSPYAQPDLADFLRLVRGTHWAGHLQINPAGVTQLEKTIAESILPKYPNRLRVSSRDRRDLVRARMPGGMKTNFLDRQFMKNFPGYAALIQSSYGLQVFNERRQLTPDGQQFAQAIFALVYEEMSQVTRDLGGISLVTPTSQWVGTQALNNVILWMSKGWLDLHRTDEGMSLSKNEKFPSERAGQFFSLDSNLQNYFILWAQDAELQRLYPHANRELALRSFEMLRDEFVNLDTLRPALTIGTPAPVDTDEVKKSLRAYDAFLTLTGKPLFDMGVARIRKAWNASSHAAENPTRAGILSLPIDMTGVALSLDELRERLAHLRRKFATITESDEDLLLLALFPKETQSLHLFAMRDHWADAFDQMLSQFPGLLSALRNSGGDLTTFLSKHSSHPALLQLLAAA